MATRVPVQSFPIDGNNDFMLIVWTGLLNGDVGEPFTLSQYADRSVQVTGTFGAGGTVQIEGSNDESNWAVLKDNQGDALTFLSAGLRQVMEVSVAIRPAVVAGDGTTTTTVSMLVRK